MNTLDRDLLDALAAERGMTRAAYIRLLIRTAGKPLLARQELARQAEQRKLADEQREAKKLALLAAKVRARELVKQEIRDLAAAKKAAADRLKDHRAWRIKNRYPLDMRIPLYLEPAPNPRTQVIVGYIEPDSTRTWLAPYNEHTPHTKLHMPY